VLGAIRRLATRVAAGVGRLDDAAMCAGFSVDGAEKGGGDGVCCMLDAKVTPEESSPGVAVAPRTGDDAGKGKAVDDTKASVEAAGGCAAM
jgi:hypothetical protein